MPNYFGPTGSSRRCPLYDPKRARDFRTRFNREQIEELDRANSLYVPCGRFPARGWILLRRADYNELSPYSRSFSLQMDDGQTPTVTAQNLCLVQARCVSRGMANDPNAVYLVEITDQRGILYNRWFQYPTASAYNVRSPAYPQNFYSLTESGVTPYSWNAVVNDLWNQMGAFLGPYPGLPIVPAATPENMWFPGTSAWESLNLILDYLGLTISVDLTSATPYGIVQIGQADANFNNLTAQYAPILEDDFEWQDAGAGRVPGSVIVYFHRRNSVYGTEETVRRDGLQWATTPLYSVPVAGPVPYNTAPGVAYLWADFTVQYDIDNNPLPADVVTAAVVAQERVTQFYDRITRGTAGYLNRLYSGVVPFATGSQLDGVCWRMQRKDNDAEGRRGWVTECVRGPSPAWPELWVETGN